MILDGKRAKRARWRWLEIEVLESRVVPTMLADWNFNSSNLALSHVDPGVAGTPSLATNVGSPSYFMGSAVNAGSGDGAGQAFCPVGTTNNGANLTMAIDTSGYSALSITFATQRTSTGFTGNAFQYTTDGVNWTPLSTYNPPSAFALQSFDLTSIPALNNNVHAGFRIVFNGASSSSGNNRIDNLTISGVPSSSSPPSVASPTATNVTTSSATLGGDAVSAGSSAVTARGVVYSLTSVEPNPTLASGAVVTDPAATTGAFSENITGLMPNANYSFVAYATNNFGTTYTSPVSTFTTAGQSSSSANLRIVSYNIASSGGAPRSGLDTILEGIGAETTNGVAEPIDVLALQEVESQATTTQDVVNLLNSFYGPGTYARGSLNGQSSGSGTQGVVYRVATVQLLSETALGTVGGSGSGLEARQPIRYQFSVVGAPGADNFYVYDSHYKAGAASDDLAQRADEAQNIRADADALGAGVNIIYVGDYNCQSSGEAFFQTLTAAGNGHAVDPPNQLGNWHNNAAFLSFLTQAPAVNPPGGLTGGGLDDRFDFELATSSLADGAGLDYRAGSYHTFGNNGSVALNGNINDPSSTALPGLANRTTILDLLTTVTDHLPVVMDLSVPASTSITVSSVVVNGDYAGITAASENGNTVTLTSNGNSGFAAGNPIVVAGFTAPNTGYNGTWTITSVSGNQIQYADSNTGLAALTGQRIPYALSANTNSDLISNQRSMVDSVAYTFNTPVNLAAGAITMGIGSATANGAAPALGAPNTGLTSLNGGTIWVVTWATSANNTIVGRSIADGVYTITLNSASVTAVSDGAVMMTTRPTDTFYRLFGDFTGYASGFARVNNSDNLQFNNTYLKTTGAAGYFPAFDFNGDGSISNTDNLQFNNRYLSAWSGFTPTI